MTDFRLLLLTNADGSIASATLLKHDEPEHNDTTGMDAHAFGRYLVERFTSDAPRVEVHPLVTLDDMFADGMKGRA